MVNGTLGETKRVEGCHRGGDEEEPKPELRAEPFGCGRRGIWFEVWDGDGRERLSWHRASNKGLKVVDDPLSSYQRTTVKGISAEVVRKW